MWTLVALVFAPQPAFDAPKPPITTPSPFPEAITLRPNRSESSVVSANEAPDSFGRVGSTLHRLPSTGLRLGSDETSSFRFDTFESIQPIVGSSDRGNPLGEVEPSEARLLDGSNSDSSDSPRSFNGMTPSEISSRHEWLGGGQVMSRMQHGAE